jgi:glycine/D-amino acid oxidase-like deaminating enzyme
MNIAIVGTGLCGLATGWFLLQKIPDVKLTFFDPLGIGGGTSGMAAGLMHPFTGAPAKLNKDGFEGYQATRELLDVASKKLGRPVAKTQGLIRLAITERQKIEYRLSAEKNPEVEWWDEEKTLQKCPGVDIHPCIFIPQSTTVDCRQYLEGLWKACEEQGAQLEKKKVDSLDELQGFDQIVLATGASVNQLMPMDPLPITKVKGQVLELSWPSHIKYPSFSFSSHAYIIIDQEKNSCIVGSTYERNFETPYPDIEFAKSEILPKVEIILPPLRDAVVMHCRAGVRASTPGHLPIVKKIGEKCWVITGMGSKGLLYHALYAKQLADKILVAKILKKYLDS